MTVGVRPSAADGADEPQAKAIASSHEEAAVAAVCTRLAERYPDVIPDVVARIVHQVHESLDGPVRDYVPLLVERIARERLSRLNGPTQAEPAPQPSGGRAQHT